MGAERVLRESGFYAWERILGVSVGALNAALLCREMYAELREAWLSFREEEIHRRYSWPGVAWRALRGKRGMHDNAPLRSLLERLTAGRAERIPCHVGFVELESGRWRLEPPLLEAVHASATMPVVWEPVEVGGAPCVDGGVRNVTPLSDAFDHDPTELVVVLCSRRGEHAGEHAGPQGRNILQTARRALDIALDEIAAGDLEETLRINDLVRQAEAQGATLRHPSGRRYRHVPITVVEPGEGESLGDILDFSQVSVRRRMALGEAAARAVLRAQPREWTR